MPSHWIPRFVVWRLTDLEPMRIRVESLEVALFWARHLRRRWREQTWIEHDSAVAHYPERVEHRMTTAAYETEPRLFTK